MKARLKAIRDYCYRSIALQWLGRRQATNSTIYPQLVCLSSDFITSYLCVDGRYELEEIDFILTHLRDHVVNRTVLDVGANIGNHTVAFAPLARKVVAFEPNPQLFAILQLNVGDYDNVEALNFGASDMVGEGMATVPEGNAGGGGIDRKGAGRQVRFALRPIDAIGPFPDVGLIKIDVEGHEEKALRGMPNVLSSPDVLVIIEQNAGVVRDGSTPAIDFLRDKGFRHVYALDVPSGWQARSWIGKLVQALFSGVPARRAEMSEVERLSDRAYPCLVVSKQPISLGDRH